MHNIGEVITLENGCRAKVVEVARDSCKGCIFYEENIPCEDEYGIQCSRRGREDGKCIIYKEIKEE